MTAAEDLTPGRPVVFRNATVLTMDAAHRIRRGDVLVAGDWATRGGARALGLGSAELNGKRSAAVP